jgi:hypothetical protein
MHLVPSFGTNRTVLSDSVISVAGHRSGGKDAFRALRYCGECQANQLSGSEMYWSNRVR